MRARWADRTSTLHERKQRSLSTCLCGQASHRDGIPLVATPERSRSVCYRTMTYSKGAPGEVMLDGTVSDPVACPSMLLYRLDEPPFGARSARRAARASRPHVHRCASRVWLSTSLFDDRRR